MKNILLAIAAFMLTGCASTQPSSVQDVETVLDAWHHAAAMADEATYFGTLAEDAVFLGTDASERWTKQEFENDMMRYFERETAWTYVPLERHVTVSADGRLAWFDERLENSSYGECRGSGVLRQENGVWRIVQYNLTIPIPNELAREVVRMIRAQEEAPSPDGEGAS